MMEHIRQFDWCTTNTDPYFVKEEDIDRCVTERIIKNKFVDPLTAYNSDEESAKVNIDWSEVFVTRDGKDKQFRTFVPCLRPLPAYPKLSSLTGKEHFMCLKVLCSRNPHIMPGFFIARPTKIDLRVFQELKHKYESEQKEYLEWARTLWSNGDCIRALRPKPTIEMVYEAEYKMRWHTVQSFPKEYSMAAQIPFTREGSFEFVSKKNLIDVNISELPQVNYPVDIMRKYTVLRPCSIPEPCEKHPCRFILPNESSVSILPTTEVHRELAQYAAEQGAGHVASEAALKALLETDRSWILPVSVCQGLRPDGEKVNVTVIGSEFAAQKEPAPRRTYKAFKHMLHSVFIPHTEKAKLIDASRTSTDSDKNRTDRQDNLDNDSDDEDNRLLIDIQGELMNDISDNEAENDKEINDKQRNDDKDDFSKSPIRKKPKLTEDSNDIGIFSCMCKDSIFEKPPPRSFKLWEVKNKSSEDKHKIIVHCSHKTREELREVILEPIPEYLIEIAGTEHSQQKLMSLALSLLLRKNATLLNARIDGVSGDLASVERVYLEDISTPDMLGSISATIHSVLEQFSGLLPGHYLLVHEPSHGANGLLYSTRAGACGDRLSLSDSATVRDEAAEVKVSPNFAPVLLPYHKYRKILPCAFTPYEQQLPKEPKKPVSRQRTPPQAIRWPRRKNRKGKRRRV